MKIIDVLNSPWAIAHKRLLEIQSIYRAHFHGEKIDWKEIKDIKKTSGPAQQDKPYALVNGVAVIPIVGVLNKNDAFMAWLYDGTMMANIGRAYQTAIDDPLVRSVLLIIDSPGGTVDGTQELANVIYNGKKGKPVIAYSDGMIASAAYWIASAADKIYISGDTVEVGSIGVVATHIDFSKQDEMYGETWTEITAGKYKRIASSHEPLSEEGRQYLQNQVDHLYTIFVNDVARNRNVSAEQVLAMADGRIFIGKQTVDVGLVDGVATLGQLTNMMSSGAMTISEEEISMDLSILKEKHPDIYQEAVEVGRKEARTAQDAEVQFQVGEGMIYGADLERERINSILAQAVPGHEAIISEAIADGKSTAGDVALKIVAAEKALRTQKASDAAADAAALNNVDPATIVDAISDALPLEEKCKKEWETNPKLREEFSFGGFAAYLAFKKNEKNVRINSR
jgi:capsid assembly protease